MATINFITKNDVEHKAEVLTMINGLQSEDEAASPVDHSRFPLTIDFFLANPSQGRIVLLAPRLRPTGAVLEQRVRRHPGGCGRIVRHANGSQ